MVDDDDQELETHLRRRRSQARRISQIAAYANTHEGSIAGSSDHMGRGRANSSKMMLS